MITQKNTEMSQKLYHYLLSAFVVLAVIAASALVHLTEESLFFAEPYGRPSSKEYIPVIGALIVGLGGAGITLVAGNRLRLKSSV